MELRPLLLGEILDRTFQLYRARFTLFLGIAAVSTILELLWSTLQLGESHLLNQGHIGPAKQVITLLTVIAGWAFSFGTAALATAAINRAVLAIYEGKPAHIIPSYSAVRDRWLTCIWVNILAFLIAWSPVILVALGALCAVFLARGAKSLPQANAITIVYGFAGFAGFLALPVCVWLSLRYALAIPACIQEGIGTLHSLKRSVSLSKGSRGRIFLLLFVVGVAWSVILMVLMSPTFILVARNKGHVLLGLTMYTLAISFLCSTLLKPLYGIGLTLLYYDARIRKEGFDVEWMLEHSSQSLTSSETLTGTGPTPIGIVAG